MGLLNDLHDNTHLLVAKITAPASIGSLVVGYVTKSNIAWGIGIFVGLCSIYASLTSAKKDRLIIRKTENELKGK